MKFRKIIIATLSASVVLGTAFSYNTDALAKKTVHKVKIHKKAKAKSKATTSNFAIILKTRNNNNLENYVLTNRKRFLSTKQFANRYGQTNKTVAAIQKYFKKYHIKTTKYAGNLVLRGYGSKANIQKALKYKQVKVKVNGKYAYRPNHEPKMRGKLQSHVNGYLGLSNYDHVNSNAAKKTKSRSMKRSPKDFINRYGVTSLKQSNRGNKHGIGIISFGGFKNSDVTRFWKKVGVPSSIKRVHVYKDTYASIKPQSDETTMDIQQAGSIAPKSNINVYVSQPTISGMVESFARAISANKSDSLSLSWGISEAELQQMMNHGFIPKSYNSIMNSLLLQGAAQGISIFNSTGDNGAYDGIEGGVTSLTVESPASSPFITAVGATSVPISYSVNGHKVKINNERAWSNDFLYPYFNKLKLYNSDQNSFLSTYFAGTGGGFSKFNPTPAYQRNVSGVDSFNAVQYWNMDSGYAKQYAKPSKLSGTATGRNLPDIVANGDPQTGYTVLYNNQWFTDGGTSIVAPQIAAVNALFATKANHRFGLWNPRLYAFANSSKSPFNTLDSDKENSNLYYTGQPGKKYNQATGLGTVKYNKLYQLMK
ncbi:hypothetical protein AKUA2003_05920 [Apilactobacillus kunkeei]|nr:hypothetical protein AKUA1001_05940 [Apilactobacillus kunkeei]CAI2589104.1 hypothetical protein AKUA2003_05920 [Apilactobacillus kunkeei]CAI2801960.1 hypothetical protein AKUA2002_05920 [Apilactobacillus kunkeei]